MSDAGWSPFVNLWRLLFFATVRGTTRKALTASTVAVLAASAVALGVPDERGAEARGRYKVRSRQIAPGLRYLRIRDSRGPNRIKVLKLDPRAGSSLDVVLANEKIPGHEPTSSMARRNDATAAINGDYTILPSEHGAGRPIHTFADNGDLITSPLFWGRNFAWSHDETRFYAAHPEVNMILTQHDTGQTWTIKHWNEAPPHDWFSISTPEGGSNFPPPGNSCSARLFPSSEKRWRKNEAGVDRDYLVESTKCGKRPMRRKGGIVVSAPLGSKQSKLITSNLVPGELIALSWSMGWAGVLDTIGGNPTLMENGRITAENCTDSYFCLRNPRTGIGVTTSGRVLLVTVDGRRPGWSEGMTLRQFANLFDYLGARSALNLDGGGSTTMWIEGRGVVNRASDGHERPVGSSIVVLPGPDPDQTPPLPYEPAPSPSSSPSPFPSITPILEPVEEPNVSVAPIPHSSSCRSLHDPGSTGGLLDALQSGAFGRKAEIPRAFVSSLDVFRRGGLCPPTYEPRLGRS